MTEGVNVAAITPYQVYAAMAHAAEMQNGSCDVEQIYERIANSDPTVRSVHVKELKRQIFQVSKRSNTTLFNVTLFVKY